ncbi:LysR family transcriptional regulator [Geodermatophilaceae bacterium NBWT11]|nr:LysR family transcriptional regulator [Geodermatophilaceae bacterium NBWT11]
MAGARADLAGSGPRGARPGQVTRLVRRSMQGEADRWGGRPPAQVRACPWSTGSAVGPLGGEAAAWAMLGWYCRLRTAHQEVTVMVHTRDLTYFLAVADQLHITRAAATLAISQPALSKQIASLEKLFGVSLFDRGPAGVTLTRAGEALVPYARRLVELAGEAAAAVRDAGRDAAKLTIGFWLSPANDVLAPAVAAVSGRYPDLRLRLRRADWTEAAAGVLSGMADVALVEAPHDEPVPGVRSHRLAVEDVVLGVGATHRLAGRDEVVPADLAGETVFVLPQEARSLSGLRTVPVEAAARVEHVTTIDETLHGIAMGLGVCVVTPAVLAAHPHPAVRCVPMRGIGQADYHVVWRLADESRPEVRDLVEELTASHARWARAR